MNGKKESAISRREFARRAALASAASLVPASSIPIETNANTPPAWLQDQPQLSRESQDEAEARFQAIVTTYTNFSEDEKEELRRLSFAAQPSLDRLRAYAVANGDAPALYLKPLVEREKKAPTVTAAHTTSPATKQP